MKSAVLIANLNSRNSERDFGKVHDLLSAAGVSIVESHPVRGGKELARTVRGAIRSGHQYIIVGGGDGAQTAVVGEFAHAPAVLGVLPLGTGNSFAQSLGIKPDLRDAVRVLAEGRIAKVDLGMANDAYFANFSVIGLSSIIARNTSRPLKKITGVGSYVLAGIGPLLRHRPFDCTVLWQKQKLRLVTQQIIVANGRFFGSTPVLPNATITDGELAFFATSDANVWGTLRTFVSMGLGKQTTLRNAHYFSAPEIEIKTRPKQPVDVDGSPLCQTPVHFRVAREALRVMVPQDFAQQESHWK
ncbi:MAG: YegS/Rv2252/BmrU family lipid kinase [Candidatus Eremiobacteraeota bacterium]|nr:YegS/Rv2252/BmrU family lipid kinase [Candidatus Eremiobacteraeota bacterium]